MALTRPFAYSEYNLEPFDQLAGEAATTAGAIYLIVSPLQAVSRDRGDSRLIDHFGDCRSLSSSLRPSGPVSIPRSA